MFKKIAESQKKHEEKHLEKEEKAAIDLEEKMDKAHRKYIEDLLMEGEEIKKIYGLVKDFACITNERLIFVDNKALNLTGKARRYIVFFYLKEIVEVAVDQGVIFGEVRVSTRKNDHELEIINKTAALRFAKEIMENMRNV